MNLKVYDAEDNYVRVQNARDVEHAIDYAIRCQPVMKLPLRVVHIQEIEVQIDPLLDLVIADVWHEGSKSFYRAKLLSKITPEQACHVPYD